MDIENDISIFSIYRIITIVYMCGYHMCHLTTKSAAVAVSATAQLSVYVSPSYYCKVTSG